MRETCFSIGNIPALLCGDPADGLYIFVHGKCGCKEEARDFAPLVCPDWQVLSVDLPGHGARADEKDAFDPWHVVPELATVLEWARPRYKRFGLRANSIGAYFSMLAFAVAPLQNCLFVSPILDMEALILGMMRGAAVTEERLEREGEIATDFGETLSWRYLTYVRQHPISWTHPTAILYGGGDTLTPRAAVEAFAARFSCRLYVMEEGEHWFHTPAQLAVLRAWTAENLR